MQYFPFGMWKSPIDDQRYIRAGGRLQQLQFGRNGSLQIGRAHV